VSDRVLDDPEPVVELFDRVDQRPDEPCVVDVPYPELVLDDELGEHSFDVLRYHAETAAQCRRVSGKSGADGQTRTADRRFTKPLLYRLSYVGADFPMILALRERVRECSENSRSRHSIVRCCSCSVTRLLHRTRAWEFDIRRRVFELGSFLSRSPPRVRGASPAWPRLPHPPLVRRSSSFTADCAFSAS
jgi:hypothetical protein